MSNLDEIFEDRRARIEAELQRERRSMELADTGARQQMDFEKEQLALRLKIDNEKHQKRLEQRREKHELLRQLELEELEVIKHEAQQAVEAEHALRLQTGGRATFEALERQQLAAALPPADNAAINALTDAVSHLIALQSAPRVVQRNSSGRVVAVTLGEAPKPGTLGGGRDARAK